VTIIVPLEEKLNINEF